MRLLAPLLLLAPLALVSAAVSSSASKFSSLLTSGKAGKSGILQLTNSLYDDLVAAPRDYAAMVLLTAQDAKFGCQMCKEFAPEYELLASSWGRKHRDGGGLFFASLDFAKGRDTFMKLGLNTAPVLFLFPPTTGPHADPAHAAAPFRYDFTGAATPAESVAAFITQHTPQYPIRVQRPYDYAKAGKLAGGVVLALAILRVAFKTLKPAIHSRNLWAALSLILILLFTSGHMFNHIRHVPYVANNGKGGISYIAGGFSNQFGMETQIVAVVYAVLAFCAISLGMKMQTIEDPSRQKFAVWAWNGVLLLAFSFLLSLFRQKNGGYPFKLPPMM
ncbi:hypothetical protein EDC01DRAFT_690843 [Geopyxis carbonaria]|nr:hypothetical protein EDC01DRAFT_690843 [Geopyxis carbonaria]